MPSDDVVVGVAVVSLEPGACREGVDAGVEIPLMVQVAPIVDDRDLRQARPTAGHPPGLVGGTNGVVVSDGAFLLRLEVDVPTAHRFVQLEEERFVDDPLIERGESILNADVVVRAPGERSLAVDAGEDRLAEDVSHSIVDGASHSVRVLGGVVPLRHRDLSGAIVRGDPRRSGTEGPVAHGPHGPGPDRGLYVLADSALFVIEKVSQWEAAFLRVDEIRHGVREREAGDDSVEEPRVRARNEELLHGAPRTAVAYRVPRLTVRLDEALLDHHRGFGREHVVTTSLRVDVQRRRRDGIALAQQVVSEDSARARTLEIARLATAAVRVDQAPVPSSGRRQRRCRRPRGVV